MLSQRPGAAAPIQCDEPEAMPPRPLIEPTRGIAGANIKGQLTPLLGQGEQWCVPNCESVGTGLDEWQVRPFTRVPTAPS